MMNTKKKFSGYDEIVYCYNFLNTIFKSIGEKGLDKNKYVSTINGYYGQENDNINGWYNTEAYLISKEGSLGILIFISIEGIRIDFEGIEKNSYIPEMIEYSVEEIKRSYEEIFDEIKDIFLSKVEVTYR